MFLFKVLKRVEDVKVGEIIAKMFKVSNDFFFNSHNLEIIIIILY